MTFKRGDRVRMKYQDSYIHGEITIVTSNNGMFRTLPDEEIICKVMWDEEWAPDYWHNPAKDLELINKT